MLKRGKLNREVLEMIDMESLVPQNHLLRTIDAAVNWERMSGMEPLLYSKKRPAQCRPGCFGDDRAHPPPVWSAPSAKSA